MELIFQSGELDEFFEQENGTPLNTAVATAGLMYGCIAAIHLAECENVGTTGLSEPNRRWGLKAFWCCGVILEAVLLDDAKRRALAAVHNSCVRIGSHPATSYHEAIYNLVRVRLLHVECENCLGPYFPKYGKFPRQFSDLRHTSFRVFGGFHGSDYPHGWVANVRGELQREADLAAGFMTPATSEPELTPNEARAKFCFEEWQSGKTLKEINVALKSNPAWEHFDDERKVRGPINSWADRIGRKPRKGQPGRRAKT